MAITSRVRDEPVFGEVVLSDWRGAGLLKPSTIKPVVATLLSSAVLRTLGALSENDGRALRALLPSLFGDADPAW